MVQTVAINCTKYRSLDGASNLLFFRERRLEYAHNSHPEIFLKSQSQRLTSTLVDMNRVNKLYTVGICLHHK